MKSKEAAELDMSIEESSQVDVELGSLKRVCAASLKLEIEDNFLEDEGDPKRWPSLWRVRPQLKDQIPEAYEPQVVSLGPLHYGKEALIEGDKIKLEIIGRIIHGQPDDTLEILFGEVFQCLDKAREAYAEKVQLSDKEFATLLVMDGCFLIAFCCAINMPTSIPWSNLVLHLANTTRVNQDIWLYENQLPFCVVNKLYNKLCDIFPEVRDKFPNCMSLLLEPMDLYAPPEMYPEEEHVRHVLHLIYLTHYSNLDYDEPGQQSFWPKVTTQTKKQMRLVSLTFLGLLYLILFRDFYGLFNCSKMSEKDIDSIPSAADLQKAGVKFQMKVTALYDDENFPSNISWRDGILEIPPLHVDELTFHKLRNLIAFEQGTVFMLSSHFTFYGVLLDELINTEEDVRVLRKSGILLNMLGSDSELVNMVNGLSKGVILWKNVEPYAKLRDDLHAFCEVPHHKWRANLVQNYFQSPWTIFSVVAAIILLVFTGIQTLLTIYPRE